MKRIFLAVLFVAGAVTTAAFTSGTAHAAKATPTPSASASAAPLPTASPEPPQIAIPRLLQKLKDNPSDRDAMIALAGQYEGIGHPEAAVPITQRLLQMGTKTAQVYYLDGTAQASLNNAPAAVSDLEAASNLEPTNLSVLGTLADLYVKTNRLQDAERVANRAVTFNKESPQAYETLASVLAAEQKWDDARAQFEKAFALDPKNVGPLIEEAQTWVAQNTIPNALTVVDRAIAADPKNVQVLVFRADLYSKEHDYAKAASAYDDAAAAGTTDSDKASVMVRKALMFAGANQASQAQGVFDTAIKTYPTVGSLHTAYGEYFLNVHNTRRGEQELLTAIRMDKTDVNAIYDMAQLKQSQRDTNGAIVYLKQLSEVAPSAQTFAILGEAYVSTHQYTKARDACAKSFEINRSPDTLGCVAGSDYSLKNYKEAAAFFGYIDSGARPFMDRNPQLLYMAGDSYARTNQKAKALDAFKRLLKMMKPGTKPYKDIQAKVAALSVKQPGNSKKKKS